MESFAQCAGAPASRVHNVTQRYPNALQEIATWANAHGATIEEARHRYAQFAALCGIASIPSLRASLVLKGGNAIDFAWFPNRSTRDLDFSLDESDGHAQVNGEAIRGQLEQALRVASAQFGIAFAVNSVRQQPPGEGRSFITYEARVGYGLSDEPQLLIRMRNNQPSPHMLPIEVSINEPICGSTLFTIDERFPQLRISTLEEIVSEKLRALLQQPIRNRNRRQDVLDIAVIVQASDHLDREKIGEFLLIKSAARGVPVSKAAFREHEIAERARLDYGELMSTTRTSFIPFDEALGIVLGLVDDLNIPDISSPSR